MNILNEFLKIIPSKTIYAHCDIPCGIYDPYTAQIAAHSVLRMTQLLVEAGDDMHKIARLTAVKEEHAEKVKEEVRIIWGDYFKEEQLEKFPDLHEKVFRIMKLASKTKQEVSLESANSLLVAVQEFSEIFYQSKGLKVKRIKSIYPTEGEMVFYDYEHSHEH